MMEIQTMNNKMKNYQLLNKKVDAQSVDKLNVELDGIKTLDDASAQTLSGGHHSGSFSSYASGSTPYFSASVSNGYRYWY